VTTLLVLFAAIGLAPFVVGLILARRDIVPISVSSLTGSVLLCALAFNLTFFWQELWLVIPKALTPGLHPILFHNDHDWTGSVPIAELLQGTGAVATFISGFGFAYLLSRLRKVSGSWRLFCFWMAFQGLYQSLTQLAVGTVLPGNDVGRALAYLNVGQAGRMALLLVAVAAMAYTALTLVRRFPTEEAASSLPSATTPGVLLISALLAVLLVIPFRLPRNLIEAALIPLIVNVIGAGWAILAVAILPAGPHASKPVHAAIAGPAISLVAVLLVFQLILRRGISL